MRVRSFLLTISSFIFFRKYFVPPLLVWDEGYHIPSAARYIKKVFFMEPHPPLGKMLISWGEMFLNWGGKVFGWESNKGETFGLENTELTLARMPGKFIFAGYRLFPVLAGWLNFVLFGLIVKQLTGSRKWALLFLPLYLFDNAIIVHSRVALLDAFMIFGILLTIWAFLKLFDLKNLRSRAGIWALFVMIFGFSFAFLTKVLALLVILLWPLLLYIKRGNKNDIFYLLKAYCFHAIFFLGFFVAVWGYHFSRGVHVVTTHRFQGVFMASSEYEKVLLGLPNSYSEVYKFWIALRDNINYFNKYEGAVLPYDLRQPQPSGSFPIMWPFGSRPIFYRSFATDKDDHFYLYFVGNPVIWFSSLAAFIIAFGGLMLQGIGMGRFYSPRGTQLMGIFVTLYLCFMVGVSNIRRLLYMSHYLTGLILTFFIFVILVQEIYRATRSTRVKRGLQCMFVIFPLMIFGGFLFYKPLTFFELLDCNAAAKRKVFAAWQIKPPFCAEIPAIIVEPQTKKAVPKAF